MSGGLMKTPLRIAVVGLGRAGGARVRAAESLEGVEVGATVTRDGGPSLDDVLRDPSIDAVFVCTPNLLHAEVARRALEAGKHAVVEYPLASGPSEARGLFELAEERERLLHVEHIELLSPSQEGQRRRAAELGPLVSGTLRFRAAGEGWIADPSLAGSPALRALARLHRLVDLFGEAEVESASLADEGARGYRLEAALTFRGGGHVRLVEERGPDLDRALDWDLELERGRLDSPPPGPAGRLFERDLACFVDRLGRRAEPYVSNERVVHVLGLVEAIEARA
jgi:biliverdin reductase